MQVDGGSGITRDKRPRVKVDLVELEIASTATGQMSLWLVRSKIQRPIQNASEAYN